MSPGNVGSPENRPLPRAAASGMGAIASPGNVGSPENRPLPRAAASAVWAWF